MDDSGRLDLEFRTEWIWQYSSEMDLDEEYEYYSEMLLWAKEIGPSAREDSKQIRAILGQIAELM